jgi:hypothetical protein
MVEQIVRTKREKVQAYYVEHPLNDEYPPGLLQEALVYVQVFIVAHQVVPLEEVVTLLQLKGIQLQGGEDVGLIPVDTFSMRILTSW